MNVNAHRSRLRRLRILQALSQAYPDSLGDRLLLTLLREDPELRPDLGRVRRSLQYLVDRGLAALVARTDESWIARATPDGIDYLEGPDPGIEGMAHPAEYLR